MSEPLHPIQGRPNTLGSHTEVTKWALVLPNGAHIINDVENELDDGLVLIALLAVLRKQKVNSSTT